MLEIDAQVYNGRGSYVDTTVEINEIDEKHISISSRIPNFDVILDLDRLNELLERG